MQLKLKAVQEVFLKAMAAGWAQNVEKIEIREFPGSKAIPFVLGDFRVLDTYFVTPNSDKSTGITTIWHKDTPVWIMHYGGRYAEEAIPFLKACLHKAYVDEHRFYGGRGPVSVVNDHFRYINMIECDDFASFVGEEFVFDLNGKCFGCHWYRGMSLLADNHIPKKGM